MKYTKLTSVKIIEGLYNKFKSHTVNTEMTLQKLANRCVYMYLNDEKFREKMNDYKELNSTSGSKF